MSRPRSSRQVSGAVAALVSVTALSCSLAIEVDAVQCTSDRDCQTGENALEGGRCVVGLCEIEPRWECLGATNPEPASEAGQSVSVVLSLSLAPGQLAERELVRELEVSLCAASDAQCQAPLQQFAASVEGVLGVDVPGDTPSYVQIRAPGLVPVLYFLGEPRQSSFGLVDVQLYSDSSMVELMSTLDVESERQRGTARLVAQDCDGNFAGGIEYRVEQPIEAADDAAIRPFYQVRGRPSVDAIRTDASGHGGFFNLPPGPIEAVASMNASAPPLAMARFFIRPGSISYAQLSPTELNGARMPLEQVGTP